MCPSIRRSAAALPLLLVLVGCGDDDAPTDGGGETDAGMVLEPTYENVAMVVARSCTFTNACHGGDGRGQGNLNFATATDLTVVLNDVPSCQYDAMPRIDPGNPDNSWFLIKMTAMVDGANMIQFTPDPGWTPDTSNPLCPGDGDFGQRMPYGAPDPLPANELEMVRQWIAMGAPGPG